jgi:hypothetical protein
MIMPSVTVPTVVEKVWFGAPVTAITVPPAACPKRRFVIVELPVHEISTQEHWVVDDTASALTRTPFGKPAIFTSSDATLADDWLDVPLPDVVTVDAPAVRIFATFADALPSVIEPPALGSGPLSVTAAVTPGITPVITVALIPVARPLNV